MTHHPIAPDHVARPEPPSSTANASTGMGDARVRAAFEHLARHPRDEAAGVIHGLLCALGDHAVRGESAAEPWVTALADAAFQRGAEAMREAAAKTCEGIAAREGNDRAYAAACECAVDIRALPLPTDGGPR